MKKHIKWMMYLVAVLIVLIIAFIVIVKLKSKDNETYENNPHNTVEESNIAEFNDVKGINSYFIIKNIVDRYVNNIKDLNGDSYINENNSRSSKEETIKMKQEEAKKFFESILDEEYKSEFNISEEKILNETKKFVQQGNYSKPDVIYNVNFNEIYEYKYENNIVLYIVSVDIKESKLNLLIKFDSKNNAYSVFLSDYMEKYNYSKNMNKNDIKINKNSINANMYNKITIGTITDEEMSKEYFNIQKNNLLYDLEKEYDKLNNEYKKIKYSNYSDFEKYFLNVRNQLKDAKLSQYSVVNTEGKYIYTLIDDSGRYYIIEGANGLVNYDVKLDNYTIETEKFKEVYNGSNTQEKVVLNINKIFSAINDKDYKYVYNKLADSFKNNYFATEQDLEEYLSEKLYENNKVNFEKFSDEGNGVYTYKIELSEISSKNGNIQEEKGDNFTRIKVNIVMQLKEGTDFVMSFSIEE